MPCCPNPDCPHRKRIGRPAEFQNGITHCSDCGSPLSAKVTVESTIRKITPWITPPDLCKRILFSLGLIAVWRIFLLIPTPGIDHQAFRRFFGGPSIGDLLMFFGHPPAIERFSVLSLGITPYLSAYMIVEILSLFMQPLKSWRAKGVLGRVKIKKVALFATFLLAFLQGYGVAIGLENTRGVLGEKLIQNPGLSFCVISALTMTTGTFVMVWFAELISSRGIGHGISILIFTGFATTIFSKVPGIVTALQYDLRGYFLLFAIIGLIALIMLMEKTCRRIPVRFSNGTEATIPLKLTSAGITPAEWTTMLLTVPLIIIQFTGLDRFISGKPLRALFPGHLFFFFAFAIGIIIIYYLFTSFFYNTRRIIAFVEKRGASIVSPSGKKEERCVDKSLKVMIPFGALYLYLVVFFPYVILRPIFNFYVDGTLLISAVAIFLDIQEEVRLRRRGSSLVTIAELHDVPIAGLVRSLLEQKGIPCHLRGYYHRALLYFFGPFIEISVLVPQDTASAASETIKKYIDANILTVRRVQANTVPEP
jgi:preprotein translocase subunit SecY